MPSGFFAAVIPDLQTCPYIERPLFFNPKYLKDNEKCGMIKTSIFYIWKDE